MLKSLGLNSGKAILRLMYRDQEQLKTQAHVSTPLLPKSVLADASSSNKDYQRVPSTSHCSKTMNETINVPTKSVSKMGNREESEDERVNMLSNKKQERDISKIEKSHSIASSHEDYDDEKNRRITETCVVQEDAYEIKFVRCNCAYMQSHSGDGFTYRGFCVTVRGEKCSGIQSGRDSGIAKG